MLALWLIIVCGLASIVFGVVTISALMKSDAGSARMQEIAKAIEEGAAAYLRRQYTTITIVGAAIFVLAIYFLGILSAIGFAIG